MRILLFIALFIIAIPQAATANSALLPVKAKIVNLHNMPLDEAREFCLSREMFCPAIQARWEDSKRFSNSQDNAEPAPVTLASQ